MRVGVIQSCYLPWRGYFDFIQSVDLFVLYDVVQYSKGSWRNRNQVKTADGLKWLTVPVSVHGKPAIDRVPIATSPPLWKQDHLARLTESLQPAPYFEDAMQLWREGVNEDSGRLSPLNARLIRMICDYLDIQTPIVDSRQYHTTGSKTERLIALLTQIGATAYLSGPAARDYLDQQQFQQHSIRLEFKSYDYLPYPQLWGDFIGAVSVLDLIANVGPQSGQFLQSQSPDLIAVP